MLLLKRLRHRNGHRQAIHEVIALRSVTVLRTELLDGASSIESSIAGARRDTVAINREGSRVVSLSASESNLMIRLMNGCSLDIQSIGGGITISESKYSELSGGVERCDDILVNYEGSQDGTVWRRNAWVDKAINRVPRAYRVIGSYAFVTWSDAPSTCFVSLVTIDNGSPLLLWSDV